MKGEAMRNSTVILGILMMAVAFAIPAYAIGGGMDGGGGMMGDQRSGLLDWFQNWRNGSEYTNSRGEQWKQMEDLDQQHNEDSAYLKYQIQMKEKELDALLNSTDPDIEKVRALHRDIRDLRAEADQEQRNYELEAARINSGYQSGNGDGWSSNGPGMGNGRRGMGYGGQMRNYGSGR
jgi:Spy/CpxP family protein refolding chaperone